MSNHLLILGCTRDKLSTVHPVPAIELYTGDSVHKVRDRLGAEHLTRTFPSRGSMVHPPHLSVALRPTSAPGRHRSQRASCSRVRTVAHLHDVPDELLLVAEADYAALLEPVLLTWESTRITRIFDPCAWADIAQVLDSWNWT